MNDRVIYAMVLLLVLATVYVISNALLFDTQPDADEFQADEESDANKSSNDTAPEVSEEKREELLSIAMAYLDNGRKVGVPEKELVIESIEYRDDWNEYFIRFDIQEHGGMPFCAQVTRDGDVMDMASSLITIDENGNVTYINNKWYPNVTVPTEPNITKEEFLLDYHKATTEELDEYMNDTRLCIFPEYHEEEDLWVYHLAWMVESYIVDAMNGEDLYAPGPIY